MITFRDKILVHIFIDFLATSIFALVRSPEAREFWGQANDNFDLLAWTG